MIPIAKPLLGPEETAAVIAVLNSGMLAQGEKVAKFEQAFANYVGTKYAIATSNGTTALHTALVAHNVGPGDEVITTPFTFIATVNAIRMAGATPVFVDIEEDSFNLNPELIEAAITPRTKAILPVHLYGQPANMVRIKEIAQKHNLTIIEDSCQAHGAEFAGKKVGSFGTGCFSFYPTKNMTTGEGGMITTNDESLARTMRMLISHGSEKKYYHDFLGYNYRLTNLAAAIGMEQLRKLDSFNKKRQENAFYLSSRLSHLNGLVLPAISKEHAVHQFTIRVTPQFKKSRDEVAQFLLQQGIQTSVFYPLPIHKQKAYPDYQHLSFPIAEQVSSEVLSLPIHPSLEKKDIDFIANAFEELVSEELR